MASGKLATIRNPSAKRLFKEHKKGTITLPKGIFAQLAAQEAEECTGGTKYKEGENVWAMYHEDQLWYRGKILEAGSSDGEWKVVFVDYGNEQMCTKGDLRAASNLEDWENAAPSAKE